jgi:hypothetical protein
MYADERRRAPVRGVREGESVTSHSSKPHRRRGRPQKFGRPSELVPLTLPTDVVSGLRRIDADLARAIVHLFETAPAWQESVMDVELVSFADRRCLIVINAAVIRNLPGVDIIRLEGHRAFLALAPGSSVNNLELAVVDRLAHAGHPIDLREQQALEQLGRQLRVWRDEPTLRFEGRSIIVIETSAQRAKRHAPSKSDGQPDVELVSFAERRHLIVVNSTLIRSLPGVDIIPLGRSRAFLALPPGRIVADLELAVVDRLTEASEARERQALEHLRGQLRRWRQDAALEFHARAIIVVESATATRAKGQSPIPQRAARRLVSGQRAASEVGCRPIDWSHEWLDVPPPHVVAIAADPPLLVDVQSSTVSALYAL